MQVKDVKILSLLLNLSIASAKIRSLKVYQGRFGKFFNMRPQIHIILAGGRGSCKSTAMNEVTGHFKGSPFMDMTEASMIGTIDQDTKEVLIGAAWDCRNSILCMDEFQFMDRTSRPHPIINVLLSLTEGNQYYKKKIALKCRPIDEIEGDLFYKVTDGQIEVKTNFALILGTMDPLVFGNVRLQALKSRCIPIQWYPDDKVLYDIADGKPIFVYKDLLKADSPNVVISKKEYDKIVNFVKEKVTDMGDFLRAIGDCCRIYAIMQEHDFKLYEAIVVMKAF